MRKLGIPPENLQPNRYTGPGTNLVPCVEAKRRPLVLDRSYPLLTQWRVDFDPVTGSEGEVWTLVRFESNGDATWRRIDFTSSSPGIDTITVDDITAPGVNPVEPDGVGNLSILGNAVANHTIPVETHSRGINEFNIDVQVAVDRTGAPATKLDAGICSFDDTAFVVDANGYVKLAGGLGPAIDSIDVDANTGPGTDPVVPDGSGVIHVSGSAVAAHSVPVETHSRAANTYNVEVQVASARTGTPGDLLDAGICSFDDTAFAVDAKGYVTLAGGTGPAVDSINVDFNTSPGTDPVLADATGLITVTGIAVANGTNANAPIATHSRAANAYRIEAQVGAAVAATPGDKYDAGLVSMDNSEFDVSTHGFTTVSTRRYEYPAGTTINLGIYYSSPTFTVTSANGSALSATNPAWIVLPSISNPGYRVVHKLTADISFEDDSGTSDLTGNTFGTTTGIAWANPMPFYIYAVGKDADAAATIMISRVPHRTTSPAAANIAKSGSAVATTQGSFFAIDSSLTVSEWDGNPCISIGSFTMAKNDAANDDWTVGAISQNDGIGRFYEGYRFDFPETQNGASSSCMFSTVGGDTIPTFTTIGRFYTIDRAGFCHYFYNWANISGNGVGSGILRLAIPYTKNYGSAWLSPPGNAEWYNQGATNWTTLIGHSYDQSTYFELIYSGTGTNKVTPANLTTDKAQGTFSAWYFTYNG